jgi:CRP-like cAMP-binding protein
VFVLADRTLDLLAEVEAATQRGAQRLATYIVSLADGNGDGGTVRLPVSKTLVAARLGVKKETLSRLLRELSGRGLIAVERREVRILDRTGLAAVTR